MRAPTREDRDLFINASNAYVVAFDNLSTLPIKLSDTLARLATGGGFGTRQLYTDEDEKLFDVMRPVLMGAIEDVVTQGDLAERTIRLQLAADPNKERRTRAGVLGGLQPRPPGDPGRLARRGGAWPARTA